MEGGEDDIQGQASRWSQDTQNASVEEDTAASSLKLKQNYNTKKTDQNELANAKRFDQYSKMPSAIYCAGRFQPPTIGHARIIDMLIDLSQHEGAEAFVFVSKSRGKKDPLCSATKVAYLKKMFPYSGVTFVDCGAEATVCGGPILSHHWLRTKGYDKITLLAGSDHEEAFDRDAPVWKNVENPPRIVFMPRDTESDDLSEVAMSATKVRDLARRADEELFIRAVLWGHVTTVDAENLYDELRHEMGLFVPARTRVPSFLQFFRHLCGC
jgi:nicotinic acid mononucleotide adenylyltransferase